MKRSLALFLTVLVLLTTTGVSAIAFAAAQPQAGRVFYVDSEAGSDLNSGRSASQAWKSLQRVNLTVFQPGDKILFRSGGFWSGALWPKGEGTADMPITIGKYGGDAYPVIAGNGKPLVKAIGDSKGEHRHNPVVFLSDQSNWIIENLEVTNNVTTDLNNVGILIFTTGIKGRTSNVTVRNCYVHDVTATQENFKMTGGIIASGSMYWINGALVLGIKKDVGFDGLYIENNHVKNVAKEGIRTTGQGQYGPFRNRKVHKNVEIRGNYIEEVLGDGIVIAEVQSGGIVENNVVKNHCNTDVGDFNYAGLWAWQCTDVVIRHNEVFGGEYGYNDGEAFDFDIGSVNIRFEYNLSHHNKGGLLLTMAGYGRQHNLFRYNISVNDGKPDQELFHVQTGDLRVYNNTIYVDESVQTNLVESGALYFFQNNIVYAPGDTLRMTAAGAVDAKNVKNNIFYPATIMDEENKLPDDLMAQNIFEDPMLQNPTALPGQYASGEYDTLVTLENRGIGDAFLAGLRERAAGYQLREESPARGAGTKVFGMPDEDFFGNTVGDLPDIGAHQASAAQEIQPTIWERITNAFECLWNEILILVDHYYEVWFLAWRVI